MTNPERRKSVDAFMRLSKRSSPKLKCYPNPWSRLCAARTDTRRADFVSLHGRFYADHLLCENQD